ncbi:uncharacterized protein LOC110988919 isoform X2 [Acanthaster planci]|uniref:Uncharacterized protein LOC110988919 isoform X2 n=1 Tax=Acanthaster planci TaxID=133434 RepID=A0A8B7ZU14_ACAPL|nr:uncharacterized protein LOC110988919 isoform X2 [Acanthaster planci]
MPPYAPSGPYSIVCCFGLLIVGCLSLNDQEFDDKGDDESQWECMLGPEDEGRATFYIGGEEHKVCRRGQFFNFTSDPDAPERDRCTACPLHTHYMDHKNHCLKCRRCRPNCSENEREVLSCTRTRNRICKPRTSTPRIPSTETTTLKATSGAGINSKGHETSSTSSNSTNQLCPTCTTNSINLSETGVRLTEWLPYAAVLYLMRDRVDLTRRIGRMEQINRGNFDAVPQDPENQRPFFAGREINDEDERV